MIFFFFFIPCTVSEWGSSRYSTIFSALFSSRFTHTRKSTRTIRASNYIYFIISFAIQPIQLRPKNPCHWHKASSRVCAHKIVHTRLLVSRDWFLESIILVIIKVKEKRNKINQKYVNCIRFSARHDRQYRTKHVSGMQKENKEWKKKRKTISRKIHSIFVVVVVVVLGTARAHSSPAVEKVWQRAMFVYMHLMVAWK